METRTWCFTAKPAIDVAVAMMVVKPRPDVFAVTMLGQEVLIHVAKDFGQYPVAVTAAVVLCLIQQALQQLGRLVDVLALQENLQDLIDGALGLGLVIRSGCWRCVPFPSSPQSLRAPFKTLLQVVTLQQLVDHSLDIRKTHGSSVAWPRMAIGVVLKSFRLEGLEPLKFLSLFILVQDLAESDFLQLSIVLKEES